MRKKNTLKIHMLCVITIMILVTIPVGSAGSVIRGGSISTSSISTIDVLNKIAENKKDFRIETIIRKPNNTRITFLKHENGKCYIVKQRNSTVPSRHIVAVRDALGSRIALDNGIPANCAITIPRGCSFPGKSRASFPASLHEVVPGVRADRLPENKRLPRTFIQQFLRKCKIYGLTRETIANMSRHPDLCRIVALDTFIANGDRHTGNFFYDAASDRYYAIDLASAFKHEAACYVCDLITSMLRDRKCILSKKELKGLTIYRDTLTRLVKQYSPDNLYECMVKHAKQGNFISCPGILRRMEDNKAVIKKNYKSCQKLIFLLNALIKKQYKRVSR